MQFRRESLKKFRLAGIRTVTSATSVPGGVGVGVLPSSRLMGMYRWMGSHFHDWIGHYVSGCIYELREWRRTISGFWGSENSALQGFKNGQIYTTLSLTNVSVHFRITYK